MAHQTILAASKGFGTWKLAAGGGYTDSALVALLLAAYPALADADNKSVLDRKITGCNLRIVAATTFFWENNGTAATTDKMPDAVGGEIIVPKNCRETLHEMHVLTTGNTDLRVMLW